MEKYIDISIKNDYAILTTEKYSFYYGYEFDTRECECGNTIDVWGFKVVKDNRGVFEISEKELLKHPSCPYDSKDCAKMLFFGIGLFLEILEKGELIWQD